MSEAEENQSNETQGQHQEAASAHSEEQVAVASQGSNEPEVSPEKDEISDEELDGRIVTPSFFRPASREPEGVSELESLQKEVDRLRVIEQEYNNLISNPLFETTSNFVKSGEKDIKKFIEDLSGGYRDISKMSMTELYETNYRSTIAKKYNLSEEDIEDAISEFNRLSPAKQAEIIDPIRDKMDREADENIKKLSEKYSLKSKEDEKFIKEYEEREKKALQSLENKLSSLVGKTLHRVPVTQEVAKELKDSAMTFAIRDPQTLEPDIDSTLSVWMWLLHGEKILKQHIRYGQNRGLEQGVIGRANGTQSPIKTNSQNPKGTVDKYDELMKKTGGKLPRVGNPTPN